jgi:nucleoid-associated protein YgaU
MQKDLKIGLIVGLAIVSAAGLWLATRPSLTPHGRLSDRGSTGPTESVKPPVVGSGAPATGDSQRHDGSGTTAPRASIRRAVAEGPTERNSLAAPAMHVQDEAIRAQRFHFVRKDETLSKISYEYYGSAGKWRKIFDANRGTVKDPHVVRPGTKLIIPD